ncbi:MAG: hypothetical protein JXB32_25675 [Deltaproteobacteria bacterium]|nr:hypothetical protein [Deltaproteobacteria bacterium]
MRSLGNFVVLLLLCAGAGCSLLYPFELPEGDAGDAPDTDVGADGDADGDGDETGPVCGNGEVEPPEECDPSTAPDPCTTDCGSAGTWTCQDCRRVCEAPVDEECNGVDDDCDTLTDEGFACAAGSTVACTTPCGVEGTGICTDTCEPPTRAACTAADEACNGCDDDRDGTTDEGCACATDWVVEHPLAPGPESLQHLTMAPDGSAVAVGSFGMALFYDGTGWTRVDSPSTFTLRWVDALSRDFAVAVGTNGSVFWWNGSAWRYDDSSGTSQPLYGVQILAEDDVWAAGASGTVIRWDGSDWRTLPTGSSRHFYRLLVLADDDVYTCGIGGTLMHYDGTSWTMILPPGWASSDLQSMWPIDDSTLWIVGSIGVIARYHTDTGVWEQVPSGTTEPLYSIWGAADDDVWVAGGMVSGDTLLHWDGTAWTRWADAPILDQRGLFGLSGTASDDIMVQGKDGGLLRWNGTAWRPMEGGVTASLRAVSGVSGQDVFVVGTANTLAGDAGTGLLRADAGRWRLADWRMGFGVTDLWAAAPDDLYAVSAEESVRHFDGSSWSALPVGFVNIALEGVWGAAPGQVIAVGGYSTVGGPVAFEGGLGGWSPVSIEPLPGDGDLLAVHGVSVDDEMAVGTGGLAVRRRVGARILDVLDTGTTETLRDVWMASATEAFAVGDNGTILRWDGTAWTSMTAPGDPWAGVPLAAVWGSSATNVFVVGRDGLLLRYDGVAWTAGYLDVSGDPTDVWGSVPSNVYITMNDRSGRILHRCGSGW